MSKIIFAVCVLIGIGSAIAIFLFQEKSDNAVNSSVEGSNFIPAQDKILAKNKAVAAHSIKNSAQNHNLKDRSRAPGIFSETDFGVSSDALPGEIEEQMDKPSNRAEMQPFGDPEEEPIDDFDRAKDDLIEHEESIQMDTEMLANLKVGQAVDFYVPQLGHSFETEIESESEQLEGVKVWMGKIAGKKENESDVIITRGETMTNVVLSTSDGVYTAHIDNKTGEGEIIDDREYTQRMVDVNDGIPFNPKLEPESE